MQVHDDEPMYVISVAARLVNMHPQTLRYYERHGLINPTRSRGRIRLYSQRDIERLLKIARLTDDLGVNLAGVQVILRLTESLAQARRELEKYHIEPEDTVVVESDFQVIEQASTHVREKTPKKAKSRRTR